MDNYSYTCHQIVICMADIANHMIKWFNVGQPKLLLIITPIIVVKLSCEYLESSVAKLNYIFYSTSFLYFLQCVFSF